jgi:RNA polymerase-binding transcription factor DksA
MKKVDFSKIDESRRCGDCNQPLKQNLLAQNPDAKYCYVCNKLRSKSQSYNRPAFLERQRKLKITWNAS